MPLKKIRDKIFTDVWLANCECKHFPRDYENIVNEYKNGRLVNNEECVSLGRIMNSKMQNFPNELFLEIGIKHELRIRNK